MTYRPLTKCLTIRTSEIDGLGLFSTELIKKDTELGFSHLLIEDEIYRTPLGGFINHSENPNCKRIKKKNKWILKTIKDIKKNRELTLSYRLYKPE